MAEDDAQPPARPEPGDREPSELAPEGWDAELRETTGLGGVDVGWFVAVAGAALAAAGIVVRIVQRHRPRAG